MKFELDRRLISLFVALALLIPLLSGLSLRPAPMSSADDFYREIEQLEPTRGKLVLVAFDFGPSTKAENESQAAVTLEHLFRRRLPFALISTVPFAAPFLSELPLRIITKLEKETGEHWEYGSDWINLGFQPNASVMIQGIVKSEDIAATLKADAEGNRLQTLPAMQGVETIRDISLLIEFTGLIGGLNRWIQFFQVDDYKVKILHGCTSITIPEAHIYLASGQLSGLHEGLAGAAWYDELLSQHYPMRERGTATKLNSSLAVAQLLIVGLIILGNITGFFQKRFGKHDR